MHISDQVNAELIQQGWTNRPDPLTGTEFRKTIEGFAPAGTISNGRRTVTLTICERGRYLSRVDGWGNVARDVDLRDYADRAADAIAEVLK